MRFSAITALCAAPLALAGSLQAELEGRQAVDVQVTGQGTSSNPLVISGAGSGSVTEIIILWVNNGGNAPTQTFNQPVTAPGSAVGAAVTHNVTIGGSAGLIFVPEQVIANVGDFVLFKFESNNHTVTQSAFETPCDPLAGGMDSGFMPNPNNTINPQPMMQMQVTVATPLWFYCRQNAHCGKGMTFSINPTANRTQEQFKALAVAQRGNGATPVIAGGPGAGAAPAPAAPVASGAAPGAAPPAVNAPGGAPPSMAVGAGTQGADGACQCSCLCGAGSFPNAAVQGVGAFGGLPGAMPMGALMA